MTISKNSKMLNLINYRLRITLSDSRVLTGQMLAFDKHMNLVLADCEEFRKIKSKKGTAAATSSTDSSSTTTAAVEREEKRTLGLVILRGETIVSLSVDGPPPPSAEDQKARMSQLAAGPGVAAPAGRGMPVVPGAAPSLTGPVRGLGGPAPGMMLPRGPAAAAAPVSYGRGMPPGGFAPPGMPPMPPAGFRPMPPGMPGMAPPPGFRPMGGAPGQGGPPPGMPPGFRPRPGMPPAGYPPVPGYPGAPPPGFQGPPPGFRPPPPGFRPPPQ